MYHGYTGVSAPVLRNPRLFNQNTYHSGLPSPSYYSLPQPTMTLSAGVNFAPAYPPQPSINAYSPWPPLSTQPQAYPCGYPTTVSSTPLQTPFPAYALPVYTPTPSVSTNGLTLILIATLILVALDLVIVRPHKWQKVK